MIVALFLIVSLVALTALYLTTSPLDDQFLVVFTPDRNAFEEVVYAGGKPVRNGLTDWLIIAQADHSESFLRNVKHRGAILVMDPIVMGGCAYFGKNLLNLTRFDGVSHTEL